MKKKLSLFLSFIIMFSSLFSFLENFDYVAYAEDNVKTAFTVEELLKMGFVSSIDFSETDLTNIYRLSQNESIVDFDNTIIANVDPNARRYLINSKGNVDYSGVGYGFTFMQKYYVFSDDEYTYYSNYSGDFSIYPYNSIRSSSYISVDTDYSVTMKNVVDNDFIIVFRKSKSTYDCNYFICRYDFYKYCNFTSVSDVFQTSYFTDRLTSYTPYYYCINREDFTTPDSTEKLNYNYNLWGVRIRSDEEIESLKLGFLDWFEQNNKIDYLIANGLDLTNQYISDIYDWWVDYGGSFPSIVIGLPKLISKVNIISWDVSLAKKLVDCFEQLYFEYKIYLENLRYAELTTIYPDSVPHWHHRDDSREYTHTTDTEDDTTVILILREILRNIIVLPESIRTSFSNIDIFFDGIFVNFNNLLYYINNLPTYIANEIKTVFNGFGFVDVDFSISDLLNDISISIDNVVDRSASNLENLLIPTAEPFSELKEEIYLKLPVLNQLTELPNFDGYIEDNFPETVSLSAVDTVASSGDKTLSMFNVSFYDNSAYNGISFDIVDFTKWQKAIDAFKGICSVVIVFHFVHWLIAFIPKLLSGYNSSN